MLARIIWLRGAVGGGGGITYSKSSDIFVGCEMNTSESHSGREKGGVEPFEQSFEQWRHQHPLVYPSPSQPL